METLDFKKILKPLFTASDKKTTLLEVPKLLYLMADGKGYPGTSPDFQKVIELLYGISYTLKFMLKFDEKLRPKGYSDNKVGALEGLYWNNTGCFDPKNPECWYWTMMIMQPSFINQELIKKAALELDRKKGIKGDYRLENFGEGKAAQRLHIGPYELVGRTVEILLTDFKAQNLKPLGKHHEIYLNDPRRVGPEKLKTIVRLGYE